MRIFAQGFNFSSLNGGKTLYLKRSELSDLQYEHKIELEEL
jgi:hypothetical protein